jgi:hypothetical protein
MDDTSIDTDPSSKKPPPTWREAFPWAQTDDEMRRCYVFETVLPLHLDDKLVAMDTFERWIKTGEMPPSPATPLRKVKG